MAEHRQHDGDIIVIEEPQNVNPTVLDEKKDEYEIRMSAELAGSNSPGRTPSQEKDLNLSGPKLAADGKTVLVPQPSDDPRDPLNW